MTRTSSLPVHRLRRAFDRGKHAGLFFFIVGAALIGPFAFYAGLAVGNGAATWAGGSAVAVLPPVVHVIGFLAGAGVIMATSGLAFGVVGWAVQAGTRSAIAALRRRHLSRITRTGSGV
jgi:hypothetical protein